MKRQLLELWIAASSDPRKLGILGALLVVALGLWGRAALMQSGPSEAEASRKGSASSSASSAKGGEHSSEKAGPTRVVTLPPIEPLGRDLFAVSEELIPQPSQPEAKASGAPKPSPSNDDKPMDLEQLRIARIMERASGLRLRSTIVGGEPIAVIEQVGRRSQGRVVRLGEQIAGFSLVKVDAGRVVLEQDGVRVELAQQRP